MDYRSDSKRAIDNPNLFWLEPQTSFSIENEMEYQLEFSINAKSFQFQCFESIVKVPIANSCVNKKLFNFYVKYSKPQYES